MKLRFNPSFDSRCLNIRHNVVSLGNLSTNRPPGTDDAIASGNCNATETADGVREAWTSSSFAPETRPVCLNVLERSTDLSLFLVAISYCL